MGIPCAKKHYNSAKQLKNAKSLQDQNQILKHISLWLPLPPFIKMNASLPWTPHIRVSSTNVLLPIQTTLSSQAIHTLLGSAIDLVKLDLVLMHFPLFTLEGAKLSYSIDPFHTMRDFIPTHGSPHRFYSPPR